MRFSRRESQPPKPGSSADSKQSPASPAQAPQAANAGPPRKPIGQVLVENGTLTSNELAEAIVAQAGSGRLLGEVLVDLGLVGERDITQALADQFQLPLANLSTTTLDPEVAMLLPESLARSLRAIPMKRNDDGSILVVTSDPRPGTRHEVEVALGTPITLALTSEPEISWALDSTHKAMSGLGTEISEFTATYGTTSAMSAAQEALGASDDDAPVIRVVNMIITQALRDRASDVHFEPQSDILRIRFRIDGVLHAVAELPASMAAPMASRIKIMSGLNIVERRRPQDGQIRMVADDRKIDIRVSTVGVVFGEKIVLRLLDKQGPVIALEDLGMSKDTCEQFQEMLHSPYGMVVCVGPTGSGKTTTLYAGIRSLDRPDVNITTIEDPVEYVYPTINQIQINEPAGLTFASGLKSILRQDPDIILVGEMRDIETARIGVQAALTGHFVMSSVHATDAVSSVHRFLDMGIEPFLVASSLLGVVGQRLVRRVCPDCVNAYSPTAEEMAFYLDAGGSPDASFVHGSGCNYCAQTGYRGRIGVYELLTINDPIREVIVGSKAHHQSIRELAVEGGMVPLRRQAVAMVANHQTTIAEIIRSIYTI